MSPQGVTGPHYKSGDDTAGTLPRQRISDGPTARARAEGKPGLRTPLLCGHGMWRGSGWPPMKRHPGYTVLAAVLPLIPLPSSTGEGEEAESGLLPELEEKLWMPRQRHRACLQHGIKLDLNRLARQGLVKPGAQTGPFVIRWMNTYWQEEIASGLISADMQREHRRIAPHPDRRA